MNRTSITTIQITSHYFCAGIIIIEGMCREAAPIIKWMVGKEYSYLRNYCFRKNWRFHIVSKDKGKV